MAIPTAAEARQAATQAGESKTQALLSRWETVTANAITSAANAGLFKTKVNLGKIDELTEKTLPTFVRQLKDAEYEVQYVTPPFTGIGSKTATAELTISFA